MEKTKMEREKFQEQIVQTIEDGFDLYRSLGWKCLPLTESGYPDHAASITTSTGVSTTSARNVGLKTGSVNGLVALVVELASPGRFEEWLGRDYIPRTPTFASKTHRVFLFRRPDPSVPTVEFCPGVTLQGEEGYVEAPPSALESGESYVWETDPRVLKPAQFPMWLRQRLHDVLGDR